MNNLQQRLKTAGGQAKGILWEEVVTDYDRDGEPVGWEDQPVAGVYSLLNAPVDTTPFVRFWPEGALPDQTELITEAKVAMGGVQIIARR